MKALATALVAAVDSRVIGANYKGSNLSLEDKILLNLYFQNVKADMYDEITYTDYEGVEKSVTAEEIEHFAGNLYKVTVDEIVLADAFSLVTVTVYNADGSVYGTASDSVESYVARAGESELYSAIMKFASSARAHFA